MPLNLVWLASGTRAFAQALLVPTEYPDLTSALAAATDGDVIDIAPGVYTGLPSPTVTLDVTIQGAGIGVTTVLMAGDGASGLITSGAITLASLTFSGDGSGRPLLVENGVLTLVGAEIVDGFATDLGGLVYVTNAGRVVATNTIFRGGRAAFGGAVALGSNATGTFTGCTFVGNEVAGPGTDGGAVRIADNAVGTFTGCTFEANRSVDHIGGALALLNGNAVATVTDCTFDGNTSGASGGAIHAFNGNDVTVTGGVFRNGSGRDGGAIACAGAPCTVDVTGTTFDTNDAIRGGHVYLEAGAATFTDVTFLGGTATEDGGAVMIRGGGSSLVLTDTRFEANHADDDGGAVFGELASVEVTRPWMCGNSAGDDGGGLYVDGPNTLTVTNGTFLANTAGAHGAAVRVHQRAGTVSQSTFVGDTSATAFGAVGHEAGADALVITGSVFSGVSSPALDVALTGPIALSWSGFWAVADPFLAGVVETAAVPLTVDPFPGLVAAECPELAIPLFRGELVDAGDPALVDPDGSPADLGATGGPEADPALWVDGDVDTVVALWDCADDDSGRSPLVVEIVGDGIDQDCSGDDLVPEDTGTTDPGTTEPTEDTAVPDDTPPRTVGDPGQPTVPEVGCGCGVGGGAGGAWLVAAAFVYRRRRSGTTGP